MKNINRTERKASQLILSLLVVAVFVGTAVLLWVNTSFSIGTSPDSIVYISAARNLLKGIYLFGVSPQGTLTPLSHYPPFYSLILALSSLTLNQDPLHAAKWLNTVVIVANMIICSILIYKVTNKSLAFTLVGCVLIATSIAPFLNVHAMAWTEPLYILLGLLGLLSLVNFFTRMQYRFLISSAFIVGLAFITRYVGITLVITGCWCLLLYDKKMLFKRLLDVLLFGAVGSSFMVGFLLRNRLLYDVTTNRSFTFHPIHVEHINQLISTATFNLALVGLLLIFVILLCDLLLAREKKVSWNHFNSSIMSPPREILILGWYIVIYTTFLIFSISFIDAYTPLDDRILSPIFIPLVIILLFIFSRILSAFHSVGIVKWFAILSLSLIITLQIRNLMTWTNNNYQYGLPGYTDIRWVNSSIIGHISELPVDATIFTNGYDALYLWTGRFSLGFPQKYSATSLWENPSYLAELFDMAESMRVSDGFIIYFDNMAQRAYYPTKQELEEIFDLQIFYETDDGTIYQWDRDEK